MNLAARLRGFGQVAERVAGPIIREPSLAAVVPVRVVAFGVAAASAHEFSRHGGRVIERLIKADQFR